MGIKSGQITCRRDDCRQPIPVDQWECTIGEDHGVPPELKPFLDDNRNRKQRHVQPWTPQIAHEWALQGRKPHGY
jgi:hypothetical protein